MRTRKSIFHKISPVVGRALFSFFIPSGLFFLVAVLMHMSIQVQAVRGLVRVYPYIVFFAGIVVGWRFNRSQLVFIILILAIADRSLLHFVTASETPGGTEQIIYNSVSFLLPMNLAFFFLMKERGILTWHSLWNLGLILIQVFGVILLCRDQQLGLAAYLEHSFFKWPFLNHTPLTQPALLVFFGVGIFFLARYLRLSDVVECGFFWALVSSYLALTVRSIGPVSSIYLATAGLILLISAFETSFSQTFRDELTGLPARRALEGSLLKLGGRYSIAMADIDNFKKFNDRYSHDVGDQVLRMVASKLKNSTGGGKAYRYGGEEFTLIFPGKSGKETIPHLERLRKIVEESRFVIRGQDRRRRNGKRLRKSKQTPKKETITISIGIAERDKRHTSPKDVIKAADKALYRAKKAGRNRVSH